MSRPDDLILDAADEVAIRRHLLLVSLGKQPAERAIEVGRLLPVHTNHWLSDQEIVVSGRRIAYVGPIGSYRGEVAERFKYHHLAAVPGFTHSPWRWVLVAPPRLAPSGFVDVQTGQTHQVVW